MSEKMYPIPFKSLMNWVVTEYANCGEIFGVRKAYHATGKSLPIFGERIETPFGPAAGPNSQLAQNIIAAYYAGARFFEVKTVQKMDGAELAACVPRPCILAADEGYNQEWSTELTVPQAQDEYIKAWCALKVLSKVYGLGDPDGFVFNMSVGYDLYLKLLEEAVLEERGEKVQRTEEVCADLAVSANIPERYVSSPEQRMDLYRRIARIRTEEDADDVVDELVDRYGDPPRAVNNLVSIALLRSQAALCGFTDISQKGLVLTFSMKEFELQKIAALSGVARFKGRILFSPGKDSSALSLRLKPGEDVLAAGRRLVETYRQLLEQKQEA